MHKICLGAGGCVQLVVVQLAVWTDQIIRTYAVGILQVQCSCTVAEETRERHTRGHFGVEPEGPRRLQSDANSPIRTRNGKRYRLSNPLLSEGEPRTCARRAPSRPCAGAHVCICVFTSQLSRVIYISDLTFSRAAYRYTFSVWRSHAT